MTLAEIKAARAAALARAEAANAKAVAGVLDAAAQTEFDVAMADADKLTGDIAASEAHADAAAARSERLAKLRAAPGPRSLESAAPAAVVAAVRERSLSDPKGGFASLGDFASQLHAAGIPGQGRASDTLRTWAAQGLNQAIGADGGFLVPPEFSATIWDGVNGGADSLLSRCDQYPIVGDSLTMNANAETSRANGSRYGGVRGYWISEAAQMTKSAPTFRQMKLEPHQMAVFTYATDKLLRNAPALSAYLARAATDEINFLTGDAIVNGTGAGKPLGLLTAGCKVSVSKETSQAAATVLQANISKMWARLLPRSRASAVWLYNPDVEPQFDGLNLPVKNVAGSENVGGISNVVWNAEKMLLKGRPVIPCEYCATLGTEGDLILADLGMYAAGLRAGVDAQTSMHLRFDYAETAFRFMFEVDGQPWLNSAITPFKGSNTLSSVITLAVRA